MGVGYAGIVPAFIFLLAHVDSDGRWKGTRQEIATCSGRSIRATQRALRWLEQMGLAEVERSHHGLRLRLLG